MSCSLSFPWWSSEYCSSTAAWSTVVVIRTSVSPCVKGGSPAFPIGHFYLSLSLPLCGVCACARMCVYMWVKAILVWVLAFFLRNRFLICH